MAADINLNLSVKLDNASEALTNIKPYLNAVPTLTINGNAIDLSALDDSWDKFAPGSNNWTVEFAGLAEDAMDEIGFDAITPKSSIRKTFEIGIGKSGSYTYYNGEGFFSAYTPLSGGDRNAPQVWSGTLQGDGVLNRTSVALS